MNSFWYSDSTKSLDLISIKIYINWISCSIILNDYWLIIETIDDYAPIELL